MFDDVFADLNKLISTPLGTGYQRMSDLELSAVDLDNIIDLADKVAGEWNGDNAGRLEDRARVATDIMEKAQELKNLITELEAL
jgi:hypothetical protein